MAEDSRVQELEGKVAQLEREMLEMNQKIIKITNNPNTFELGTKNEPIRGIRLKDSRGGKVGLLDYDGANNAARFTEI